MRKGWAQEAAHQGRDTDGAVLDSRMAHEIQDRLAAARRGTRLYFEALIKETVHCIHQGHREISGL